MKNTKALAAGIVAAILAAVSITLSVTLLDDEGELRPTVTIRVDGADRDKKRDDPLVLGPSAQDVREDVAEDEAHVDVGEPMRGPDPAPAGKLDGPLAAQEWPGCKTAFVRSFSSRRGVTPKAFALHYTAGSNRVGWSDLDGLTAYSNNPRNQVSWHFGIDREGNCTYNVPVNHKAWTIAGLNSQTINVEMVGTGREPDYGGGAGLAKLAQIVARVNRLYGISDPRRRHGRQLQRHPLRPDHPLAGRALLRRAPRRPALRVRAARRDAREAGRPAVASAGHDDNNGETLHGRQPPAGATRARPVPLPAERHLRHAYPSRDPAIPGTSSTRRRRPGGAAHRRRARTSGMPLGSLL